KGQSPDMPVRYFAGGIRLDGQASGGNLDHKAQAPDPDATVMTQTCPPTPSSDRRRSDPELVQQNRCAGGSDAANPRPNAAPDRVRRGPRDSGTAQRGPQGTPRGNPPAPTT